MIGLIRQVISLFIQKMWTFIAFFRTYAQSYAQYQQESVLSQTYHFSFSL